MSENKNKGQNLKIDLTSLQDIPTVLKQLRIIDKKLDSNIEKRWLNTQELANYTGYKLETIKSKIKKHEFIIGIQYFKRDGKLLFDKFEVDKWVMGIKPSNHKLDGNCIDIVNEVLASI